MCEICRHYAKNPQDLPKSIGPNQKSLEFAKNRQDLPESEKSLENAEKSPVIRKVSGGVTMHQAFLKIPPNPPTQPLP